MNLRDFRLCSARRIAAEGQRKSDHLKGWEERFRTEAHSDGLALFRDHLRRLGLPEEPELLLEGTIRVMQAIWVYTDLDGESFGRFLDMQKYDPCHSPEARYAFTFDLCGKAFARVLVNGKLDTLDMADLYDHPFEDYEVSGYQDMWISHTDWSPMTSEEFDELEDAVRADLHYDYTEDELNFCFDPTLDVSYLFGRVNDIRFDQVEMGTNAP